MNRDALVDAMAMAAGGTAWPAMTEELHNLLRDGARKGLDVAEPVLRHWFALDARVVSERLSGAHDGTEALRAEVERLREALGKIANTYEVVWDNPPPEGSGHPVIARPRTRPTEGARIALAALKTTAP